VSPADRRSRRYGFDTLDTMTVFFSRWIPETEIEVVVKQSESNFRPRLEASHEETDLQKIQKAEFAIVRKLVMRNPSIP
jgi:hypothetical protein